MSLPGRKLSLFDTEIASNVAASDLLVALIGAPKANKNITFAGVIQAGFRLLSAAVVNTVHLIDEAVTTGKIADGAVTADKLASNSVTGGKIANGAVTHAKLGSDIVGATRTVLGQNANAPGNHSVALGRDAQATETYSIALGAGSQANGTSSVALGRDVVSSNAFPLTIRAGNFRLRYNTGNGKLEASKNNGGSWQTVNVSDW